MTPLSCFISVSSASTDCFLCHSIYSIVRISSFTLPLCVMITFFFFVLAITRYVSVDLVSSIHSLYLICSCVLALLLSISSFPFSLSYPFRAFPLFLLLNNPLHPPSSLIRHGDPRHQMIRKDQSCIAYSIMIHGRYPGITAPLVWG